MPDLRLDKLTHDILLVDGDFELTTTEDESLAQRLKVKLLTWQSEWYLDSTVGIPYIQSILGKNRSLQAIEAIFQDAILEEPEVLQLVSLNTSLNKVNRILTVTFNVRSASGDEIIPVELQI